MALVKETPHLLEKKTPNRHQRHKRVVGKRKFQPVGTHGGLCAPGEGLEPPNLD